jgi:hypothetical protein
VRLEPVLMASSPSVKSEPPVAGAPSVLRHFVCRLSALSSHLISDLHSDECSAILSSISSVDDSISADINDVSTLLFRAIGAVEDRQQRQSLIKCRRELFNERLVSSTVLEVAVLGLDATEASRVRRLNTYLAERQSLLARLENAYETAMCDARDHLRRAVDIEAFRKGILASSDALYGAMESYRSNDGRRSPGARARTERGLLRYLTRASMKATPFGTFCTILPGEFIKSDPAQTVSRSGLVHISGSSVQRSVVRLNKRIYADLAALIQRNGTLRDRLLLQLNPTIVDEENGLVFLSVRRGRESFQRVAPHPVYEVVRDALNHSTEGRFGDLTRLLSTDARIEATAAEATDLLNHLVTIGFLRLALGIREQEARWDVPLAALLDATSNDAASVAASQLRILGTLGTRWEVATSAERPALLSLSKNCVEAALEALGAKKIQYVPLPFMEDASAGARATLERNASLEPAFRDLDRLIAAGRRISIARIEQANMRHFFDVYYGVETRAVPLMQFYEDYHREHRKAHLDIVGARKQGQQANGYDAENPFRQEFIDTLFAARRRLAALVTERCAGSTGLDEIDVSPDEVDSIVCSVPAPADEQVSVDIFASYVPGQQNAPSRFVVRNGFGEGFGKFFSRFLHLLPDEITADLRSANQSSETVMLAEICGDANFNANLHPPLMDWEIGYPTGEAGVAGQQIAAADIVVERHAKDSFALTLYHSAVGRRVIPVDLGILNPDGRPALYQLLSRFTPACHISIPLSPFEVGTATNVPLQDARTSATNPPSAPVELRRSAYRPRVVFNNGVVLARRTWYVLSDDIPTRGPEEKPHRFFARINRWRREIGIPREAFMRMWPRQSAAPVDSAAGAAGASREESIRERVADTAAKPVADRGSKNLSKPQYIDFESPLVLNMFEHAVTELPLATVVFEEYYPAANDLPLWEGRPRAMEIILQIDYRDRFLPDEKSVDER